MAQNGMRAVETSKDALLRRQDHESSAIGCTFRALHSTQDHKKNSMRI
jgi:hypothetical protein